MVSSLHRPSSRKHPLRKLHSRHPKHVAIYLGLSWLDVESLLDTCQAVILPAAQPLLLALAWSKPVFYPDPLPWDAPGLYPYESIENLLARLHTSQLATPSPHTHPTRPTMDNMVPKPISGLHKLKKTRFEPSPRLEKRR